MSGGSFNYLCYKSSEQLLESDNDLADMEDALRRYDANDAADETAEIREK